MRKTYRILWLLQHTGRDPAIEIINVDAVINDRLVVRIFVIRAQARPTSAALRPVVLQLLGQR